MAREACVVGSIKAKAVSFVLVALVLCSCGGGGGSNAVIEPPFEPALAELAAAWEPLEPAAAAPATAGEIEEFLLAEEGFVVFGEALPDDGSGFSRYRTYYGFLSLSGDTLSGQLSFFEVVNPAVSEKITGKAQVTLVAADLDNMAGTIDLPGGSSLNFELARGNDLQPVAVDARLAGVWDGGAYNPAYASFLGNSYPFGLEFDNAGNGFGSLDSVCTLDVEFDAMLETPTDNENSSTGTIVLHQVSAVVDNCEHAGSYYGIAVVSQPFSATAMLIMNLGNAEAELSLSAGKAP